MGAIGTGPLPGHSVVVCTYQAVNVYYYKYSVGGMNVCLVNFIPFAILALIFGYVPGLKIQNEVRDGGTCTVYVPVDANPLM